MVTLQISEPGSFPTKIDLSRRWGPDHTVVIGRSLQDAPNNHISFRKFHRYLSRQQFTIMAINGDEGNLVVRDGAKSASNQLWSSEWKHTYINSTALSNQKWTPLRVCDRIRFHIEKPPILGYSVQLSVDTTDSTHGIQTMRFDTVKVWAAISRAANGIGTMLLDAPHADGVAIILRLDGNAESLLGAERGELKEVEETVLLNNLLPMGTSRTQLAEQISEAMVRPSQRIKGTYDFGAGRVELTVENRYVNATYALLAWVEPVEAPKKEKPQHTPAVGWQAEAVRGFSVWANANPRMAGVLLFVGLVLAVAVVVVKLSRG